MVFKKKKKTCVLFVLQVSNCLVVLEKKYSHETCFKRCRGGCESLAYKLYR